MGTPEKRFEESADDLREEKSRPPPKSNDLPAAALFAHPSKEVKAIFLGYSPPLFSLARERGD